MPPIVYLAIGGRSTLADLQVALAVGQRHFLVPAGTAMADTLRTIPADVRVVLDSGAWPIHNPDRLTLPAYAAAIMRWHQPDGSWGRLDWCAAYDHITDPAATQRDYRRLVGTFHASGVENTPVVPVTHYPDGRALDLLLDLHIGIAGSAADPLAARPCYGIGGLVPALAPTRPHHIFDQADRWYDALITELEQEIDAEELGIDPARIGIHLFGIGRPSFTCRSPLVASFDTSGPLRQASFGWRKIAPSYDPAFGLSVPKLQTSRAARLAYWIMRYRALVGLDWQPVAETQLPNDREPPPFIQLPLFDRVA